MCVSAAQAKDKMILKKYDFFLGCGSYVLSGIEKKVGHQFALWGKLTATQ